MDRGQGPVVIGRIGRPHGVTGEMRAVPTGPTLATIAPGERVLLASSSGDARDAVIAVARTVAKGVLIRLRGVDSREEAAALTGWTIAVPVGRLAPLGDPDEFYVRDLVGCEVRSGGRVLGTVGDVYGGASNDALVVVDPSGAETLVPFTHEAIVALDVAGRMVTIRPDLFWEGA